MHAQPKETLVLTDDGGEPIVAKVTPVAPTAPEDDKRDIEDPGPAPIQEIVPLEEPTQVHPVTPEAHTSDDAVPNEALVVTREDGEPIAAEVAPVTTPLTSEPDRSADDPEPAPIVNTVPMKEVTVAVVEPIKPDDESEQRQSVTTVPVAEAPAEEPFAETSAPEAQRRKSSTKPRRFTIAALAKRWMPAATTVEDPEAEDVSVEPRRRCSSMSSALPERENNNGDDPSTSCIEVAPHEDPAVPSVPSPVEETAVSDQEAPPEAPVENPDSIHSGSSSSSDTSSEEGHATTVEETAISAHEPPPGAPVENPDSIHSGSSSSSDTSSEEGHSTTVKEIAVSDQEAPLEAPVEKPVSIHSGTLDSSEKDNSRTVEQTAVSGQEVLPEAILEKPDSIHPGSSSSSDTSSEEDNATTVEEAEVAPVEPVKKNSIKSFFITKRPTSVSAKTMVEIADVEEGQMAPCDPVVVANPSSDAPRKPSSISGITLAPSTKRESMKGTTFHPPSLSSKASHALIRTHAAKVNDPDDDPSSGPLMSEINPGMPPEVAVKPNKISVLVLPKSRKRDKLRRALLAKPVLVVLFGHEISIVVELLLDTAAGSVKAA